MTLTLCRFRSSCGMRAEARLLRGLQSREASRLCHVEVLPRRNAAGRRIPTPLRARPPSATASPTSPPSATSSSASAPTPAPATSRWRGRRGVSGGPGAGLRRGSHRQGRCQSSHEGGPDPRRLRRDAGPHPQEGHPPALPRHQRGDGRENPRLAARRGIHPQDRRGAGDVLRQDRRLICAAGVPRAPNRVCPGRESVG